jgi:hypothetical protein
MQRGACEALSIGKPIITSNWLVLRNYFYKGTVHVDNSIEGIRQGVIEMKENYQYYLAGIKELQLEKQFEWIEKTDLLTSLINKHFPLLREE